MSNAAPKRIVVAGDVSVDWLQLSVPAAELVKSDGHRPLNWQLQAGSRMTAMPGGALLLSRLVGLAAQTEVITHRLEQIEMTPPEDVIHSIVELDSFPRSSDKKDAGNLVYRVKRFQGFSGPSTGAPRPLPVNGDDPGAGLVILDDAGNGFRDTEELWPRALGDEGSKPIVIHKISRPLCEGKLWDLVRKAHADRLIVVVSADDLRADGVNISRRLSWERTAKDFVWQIACNSSIIDLTNCANLVVRFGIDGAIHYTRLAGRVISRLYYDPSVAEDGFRDDCKGEMIGFTSAFVAALASRVAKEGLTGVGEGVRDGLRCSRRLFRAGFGKVGHAHVFPGGEIFEPHVGEETQFADVVIPNPEAPEPADPQFWCILKDLRGARLEDVAYDIVKGGEATALKNVPLGKFGNLRTVDRAEIESFRSIKNLMLEYLENSNPKRPLSIAVFGPPGSGKSFGVTEIAESLAPGRVERREFNMAQFGSVADLVSALHKVQDIAVSGQIPLIFFDEFDSSFEGKLGWLKYLLAPMQDGAFKDGETMHPIGKALFVFAGGTSTTYEEFCREGVDDTGFRDAKGPDFVSRLRGYVNILGPNPVSEGDHFSMIRRAMLLRSLLERKAGHFFDRSRRASIDQGVLRALLKVPKYKHGARSMEAILDMSMLTGRKIFEQAALPPTGQLKLHVDAETFSRLVVRDVLFGGAREVLGKAIHEQYRKDQKDIKPKDDPSMLEWEALSEDLRESSRQQADGIPEKLRLVGCGFTPVVGRDPVKIEFRPEEIELLAEKEHDRWNQERLLAGWSLGPRDPDKKISPYLVAWEELTEDVKDYDRNTVRRMPDFMAGAGFEIYRLD
jgi:hypothetical protein